MAVLLHMYQNTSHAVHNEQATGLRKLGRQALQMSHDQMGTLEGRVARTRYQNFKAKLETVIQFSKNEILRVKTLKWIFLTLGGIGALGFICTYVIKPDASESQLKK